MNKNHAINRLNNSKVDDKDTLLMWILVEIKPCWSDQKSCIYFRDIYSSVNGKWYRK